MNKGKENQMHDRKTHGRLIVEISADHEGWEKRLSSCLPSALSVTAQCVKGHNVCSIVVDRRHAAETIKTLLEEFDRPGFAYR